MRRKNKVKYNKGSALTLAIIATALLSIVIGIITFQINNQLRFNQKSYNDMQSKYAAEAGIEKSINEIVMDINTLINENSRISNNYKINTHNSESHSDCPKVRFENGMPVINNGNYTSGDGFARLIYYELIDRKSNETYNSAFGANLVSILGSDYELLVGESDIRQYYEINILGIIKSIAICDIIYNEKQLEENINYFINKLNIIISDVTNTNNSLKNLVINELKKMEEYMLEIKCRLGMNNSVSVPDENNGNITLPYYRVSIVNKDLSFSDMYENANKLVSIGIEYDDNSNIINIDFSKLNAEYLEAISDDYRIRADIDFIFVKNGLSYEIQQRVNSYERVN